MVLVVNAGAALMASNENVMGVPAQDFHADELHAQEWMSSLTMAVPREWDFINITDPKQRKDSRIQKLVRVKAQRHVRKCQRKEQEPKSSSPGLSPNFEATRSQDSPSYLGQLTLRDPGVPTCYPIQMKPYMQALLDRFVQADLGTFADIIPMRHGDSSLNPLKIQWLSFAASDPALLHSLLLVTSIRVPTLSGENIPAKALVHQCHTINLVNKAIQDERPVDEGIIAAVVGLTGYECVRGNFESWRIHMSGLEALLKARGGIESCSWLLRRMIYIIDHVGAVLVSSTPRFPLINEKSSPSSPFSHPLNEQRSIYIPYVSNDIETLFNDAQVLAKLLDQNDGSLPIQWARSFIEKRENIEYRLTSFNHGDNRWSEMGRLDECSRLALLVFTNTVARRLQPIAPLIINLTFQLRTALVELGPEIAGSIELRELLFWILFTGGRVSSGSTREWFIAKLRILNSAMDVLLWSCCKSILKRVIWYGKDMEDRCRLFWLEVISNEESPGAEGLWTARVRA